MKMTKEYILDDMDSVMRSYQPFMAERDPYQLVVGMLKTYFINHSRLHNKVNGKAITYYIDLYMNDIIDDLAEILQAIKEEILLKRLEDII